jgi:hypothetical protein
VAKGITEMFGGILKVTQLTAITVINIRKHCDNYADDIIQKTFEYAQINKKPPWMN